MGVVAFALVLAVLVLIRLMRRSRALHRALRLQGIGQHLVEKLRRYLPGKLLQTQPAKGAPQPVGTWNAIDLDLSRLVRRDRRRGFRRTLALRRRRRRCG